MAWLRGFCYTIFNFAGIKMPYGDENTTRDYDNFLLRIMCI